MKSCSTYGQRGHVDNEYAWNTGGCLRCGEIGHKIAIARNKKGKTKIKAIIGDSIANNVKANPGTK